MALWQEGDILGPTNLNSKGASATSSGGFSTNTLQAESGATLNITPGTVLVSEITQAREAFAWGGGAPSTTYCRLTTNLTEDQYGLAWNYKRSNNTQDDPTKSSWRMTGGHAGGASAWFVSYAPAGASTHSFALYVDPHFTVVGDSGFIAPTGPETLQVSGSTMRLNDSFIPATGTSSGRTGDISWGSGFIYVCVSTNSWRRATLAAF